jgi:hypothetical protein
MSKLLAAAGLLGYLAGADAFAAGPGLSHAPRCGNHAGRASGGVGALCMKSAKASSEVESDTNVVAGVDSVRRGIIGGGAALAAGTIVGSPYGQEAFAEGASAVEFSTISTDLPCAKILTGEFFLPFFGHASTCRASITPLASPCIARAFRMLPPLYPSSFSSPSPSCSSHPSPDECRPWSDALQIDPHTRLFKIAGRTTLWAHMPWGQMHE